GEGLAQAARTLGGRLDDQLAFLSRYPAGTATRPLRVQGAHPLVVEGMDHLAHPVRAGLDQPGDRRHVVAARRGEHDERSAPLDDRLVGLSTAPAHDPLELPALLVGEPPHLHWSSHGASLRDPPAQVVDAPRTLVVRALAASSVWAIGARWLGPRMLTPTRMVDKTVLGDRPGPSRSALRHEVRHRGSAM